VAPQLRRFAEHDLITCRVGCPAASINRCLGKRYVVCCAGLGPIAPWHAMSPSTSSRYARAQAAAWPGGRQGARPVARRRREFAHPRPAQLCARPTDASDRFASRRGGSLAAQDIALHDRAAQCACGTARVSRHARCHCTRRSGIPAALVAQSDSGATDNRLRERYYQHLSAGGLAPGAPQSGNSGICAHPGKRVNRRGSRRRSAARPLIQRTSQGSLDSADLQFKAVTAKAVSNGCAHTEPVLIVDPQSKRASVPPADERRRHSDRSAPMGMDWLCYPATALGCSSLSHPLARGG
jgi:hypothetical protein